MKNTAILLFVFMSSIVHAQNKTADDFNLSKTRLAVQGYDVVSYFNDEPKDGDKAIHGYTFTNILSNSVQHSQATHTL